MGFIKKLFGGGKKKSAPTVQSTATTAEAPEQAATAAENSMRTSPQGLLEDPNAASNRGRLLGL